MDDRHGDGPSSEEQEDAGESQGQDEVFGGERLRSPDGDGGASPGGDRGGREEPSDSEICHDFLEWFNINGNPLPHLDTYDKTPVHLLRTQGYISKSGISFGIEPEEMLDVVQAIKVRVMVLERHFAEKVAKVRAKYLEAAISEVDRMDAKLHAAGVPFISVLGKVKSLHGREQPVHGVRIPRTDRPKEMNRALLEELDHAAEAWTDGHLEDPAEEVVLRAKKLGLPAGRGWCDRCWKIHAHCKCGDRKVWRFWTDDGAVSEKPVRAVKKDRPLTVEELKTEFEEMGFEHIETTHVSEEEDLKTGDLVGFGEEVIGVSGKDTPAALGDFEDEPQLKDESQLEESDPSIYDTYEIPF